MTTIRVLVLTEDSGKQAIPVIQVLVRSAFRLLALSHDPRRITIHPLPSNEGAIRACHANRWKDPRSPERPRLLALIAGHLLQDGGVVVFHVDSDTTWTSRSTSENRQKFEAIIRRGVKAVLCGSAPNPIARRPVKYLDATEAEAALGRLVVMHPCYSIESWLYQAVDDVLARCRAKHANEDHQRQIESWRSNRALLDEVSRPKEMLDCVADRHNDDLAALFPAADVHAAMRSWAEFIEALTQTELIVRLSKETAGE